jgi:hypothetical protein
MVLLRSEEEVDDWCRATGEPHGEIVPLARVWELSQAWYGDRMRPEFRGRSLDDAHEIFRDIGLISDFWLG